MTCKHPSDGTWTCLACAKEDIQIAERKKVVAEIVKALEDSAALDINPAWREHRLAAARFVLERFGE